MSMDSSGKIIWAKHSEVQQANIKALADQEIKDGERLSLAVKDMGSCEIYPQTIAHNPNGRYKLNNLYPVYGILFLERVTRLIQQNTTFELTQMFFELACALCLAAC